MSFYVSGYLYTHFHILNHPVRLILSFCWGEKMAAQIDEGFRESLKYTLSLSFFVLEAQLHWGSHAGEAREDVPVDSPHWTQPPRDQKCECCHLGHLSKMEGSVISMCLDPRAYLQSVILHLSAICRNHLIATSLRWPLYDLETICLWELGCAFFTE